MPWCGLFYINFLWTTLYPSNRFKSLFQPHFLLLCLNGFFFLLFVLFSSLGTLIMYIFEYLSVATCFLYNHINIHCILCHLPRPHLVPVVIIFLFSLMSFIYVMHLVFPSTSFLQLCQITSHFFFSHFFLFFYNLHSILSSYMSSLSFHLNSGFVYNFFEIVESSAGCVLLIPLLFLLGVCS